MGKKVGSEKELDVHKRSKNIGIIISLVFFILLVCSEVTYIIYDLIQDNLVGDNSNDSSNNNSTSEETNKQTINIEEEKGKWVVLINEDIEKYSDNEEIINKLIEYKEKITEITNEEQFKDVKAEFDEYMASLEDKSNDVNIDNENDLSEDENNSNREENKNDTSTENGQTNVTNTSKPSNNTTNKQNTGSNSNNTNKKPNTSSGTTKPNASLESVLNSASLNPIKTGDSYIDSQVEKIINSQTNSSMSTYQKVKALYDWVINVMDYQIAIIDPDAISTIVNETGLYYNDAYEVYLAKSAFKSHLGSCDNYSAMFMIITRRIGLDSYTISAKNKKDGSGHTTVNIKINGTWYDFDTQGDDNSKTNGKINYIFFGKKDSEIKSIYTYPNRDKDVSDFKKFQKQSDKLETKITIGNKTVSLNAYTKSQIFADGIIEIELEKGQSIPIKVESNHEVEYNWNTSKYDRNSRVYFYSDSVGKVKSGTLNYNLNYFQRTQLNISLKDSQNREVVYSFYLNVKEKGGTFAVVMNIGDYQGTFIEFGGNSLNGTGEVKYTAKTIETDDPNGISGPKIESSNRYVFKVSNIDYSKYYYIIEVTAKDAVGNVAKTTYTIYKHS